MIWNWCPGLSGAVFMTAMGTFEMDNLCFSEIQGNNGILGGGKSKTYLYLHLGNHPKSHFALICNVGNLLSCDFYA
jgi:hypothetical protein